MRPIGEFGRPYLEVREAADHEWLIRRGTERTADASRLLRLLPRADPRKSNDAPDVY